MVRAGQTNTLIDIEAPTGTANAHGGVSQSFAHSMFRWAQFMDTRGREYQHAQATHADLTHVLRLRHVTGLTPKHRFKYTDFDNAVHTLDIIAIANTKNRNDENVVYCREVL